MAKLKSTLPSMFIVLTLIAVISAAALAATYGITSPILEEQARTRQIQAIAAVVPAFDNAPTEEAFQRRDFADVELYPARLGPERVGTAARSVTPTGYGGDIALMVGFDADGVVEGVRILSHSETPGLGAKVVEADFLDQFVGLDPATGSVAVVADGGRIDSITAATISSRAVCTGIARAWEALQSE